MAARMPKWDGKTPVLEWALSLPEEFAGESPKAKTERLVDLLNEGVTVDLRKAQSPIEERMFFALIECGFNTDEKMVGQCVATLYQQCEINVDRFRVHADFAVVRHVGKHFVKVAIELDGYEWHQKTKEQVVRDYQRDRALTRKGWAVLRYLGTEVWRDAGACALDVAGVVIEAVDRLTERP